MKFINCIKKGFDSELVYNEKYLKNIIKSCKEKTNKKFHNKKISKEDSQCICLSLILIDSVYRKDKKYYPQVFLEEYKLSLKKKLSKKLMSEYVTDKIEISSDDSDGEYFDEENSGEEN